MRPHCGYGCDVPASLLLILDYWCQTTDKLTTLHSQLMSSIHGELVSSSEFYSLRTGELWVKKDVSLSVLSGARLMSQCRCCESSSARMSWRGHWLVFVAADTWLLRACACWRRPSSLMKLSRNIKTQSLLLWRLAPVMSLSYDTVEIVTDRA